ncbi:hypothetical protein [Paraflavitalea speifideaquila]|uniref:hypothetical protein n=1 Tax=Paraflavitalea speifideaquila TaxID=3076558 RepID=UPI0028E1FE44|nr:hypothetical protein [Paraflavitalea speifideiaquila]
MPWLNEGTKEWQGAVEKMMAGKSSVEALKKYFRISAANEITLLKAQQKQHLMLQPTNTMYNIRTEHVALIRELKKMAGNLPPSWNRLWH